MSELLRERTVHKYYRLFAAGRMELEGVTQAWLIKDEKNNQVRILSAEPKGNKAAAHIVTGCRPLTFYPEYTYAEVELFTGKSHQIRAHLPRWAIPLSVMPNTEIKPVMTDTADWESIPRCSMPSAWNFP